MNEPMDGDPITRWAESIARLLSSHRDLAGAIATHGPTIGKAREFFISEVLQRFLPRSVHVGSGQIVDSGNRLSRQVDILIYRPDCPVLSSLTNANVYFAAGTIATIEVKSELTGGENGTLWEALENSLSVKNSEFDYSSKDPNENQFEDLRYIAPSTYIFGYRGYKDNLPQLRTALRDWIAGHATSLLHLPDVIVSQGCVVVKNDYRFFGSNAFRRRLGFNPVFLAARDEIPLQWLLYHLLSHITACMGETSHSHRGIRYFLPKNHVARKALEDSAEFWGKWDFDQDKGRIVEFE